MVQKRVDNQVATQKILKDERFQCVPIKNSHQEIGDALDLDFSDIIYAAANIPLCIKGQEHVESRKRLAKIVGARSKTIRAELPSRVAEHMSRLKTPGRHDMMQDVIIPLVDAVFTDLVECEFEFDQENPMARIFSNSMGVAKRRRLQKGLKELRASFHEQLNTEDETAVGDRMALTILGHDATIGCLGRSLHAYFSGSDKEKLTCPAEPTHTGVPFTFRMAQEDAGVDGFDFAEGDIARNAMLLLEEDDTKDSRMKYFGTGAHTCLGKPITLQLWGEILKFVKDLDVCVVSFKMRELQPDDVFTLPEEFIVESR